MGRLIVFNRTANQNGHDSCDMYGFKAGLLTLQQHPFHSIVTRPGDQDISIEILTM